MESFMCGLSPSSVFKIFGELAAIPHGSGNTEKLCAYCESFAKEHKLKSVRDKAGNIVIYKAASKGCETHPAVILQGHLDMVCEKAEDKIIDFSSEGLTLKCDGDFLYADGTTLGGDDGIAVAMILSLLSDDSLSHPPIEAVFTADEETGMTGASALDVSLLSGKTMLNLDSEDENTLWVSCAGGVRANAEFSIKHIIYDTQHATTVKIGGLTGGHSGTEIDKNRKNAVMLMAEFLIGLDKILQYELAFINSGLMDNAIPREVSAGVSTENIDKLFAYIEKFKKHVKDTSPEDKGFFITCTDYGELTAAVVRPADKERVLGFLSECPNGVIKMSDKIDGLTETSLNLGISKFTSNSAVFSYALRSSVNSDKISLAAAVTKCAEKFGGKVSLHGDYPAWEYADTSPLRDIMTAEYKKLTGKDISVKAIHAGLECGIFYSKIPELDCVSFGPDIFDIHTPSERLSISSVERVYKLIISVLSEL